MKVQPKRKRKVTPTLSMKKSKDFGNKNSDKNHVSYSNENATKV